MLWRDCCVYSLYFFTFIYNFVDVAGVSGSCVPHLIGVGGSCSRRRLLAGFPMRSHWACDAAGRLVMVGFLIIVIGF